MTYSYISVTGKSQTREGDFDLIGIWFMSTKEKDVDLRIFGGIPKFTFFYLSVTTLRSSTVSETFIHEYSS